jgi:hypothetical protein
MMLSQSERDGRTRVRQLVSGGPAEQEGGVKAGHELVSVGEVGAARPQKPPTTSCFCDGRKRTHVRPACL